MIHGFYQSRVIPKLLIGGLLLLSAAGISRAELGGCNPDSGRMAIITRYYGVTSEEVEQIITLPMEEAVADLPGIKELQSSSEFSLSRIDLMLTSVTDERDFQIRLRENVDRVYRTAKKNYPAIQKPQIVCSGRNQQAVFSVAFSQNGRTAADLRPIVENQIKPSYERIPGLGEVAVAGGSRAEIHVEVDTQKAAALKMTCTHIASFIQSSNLYQNTGDVTAGNAVLPVSIDGRLKSIFELRNLLPGKNLRLGEITQIDNGRRQPENISRLSGKERVSLNIKSSSSKLISVSRRLRALTAKWKASGFFAEIIFDQGRELEDSFWKVAAALAGGMLLSGLILIILDGNPRRAVLLLAGQPVLIIVSLGFLSAIGVPFDPYLLAGLSIGTGMVLDSALLLTESILKAGIAGIGSIRAAIVSSTLSSLIALLPLFTINEQISGASALAAALAVQIGFSLILSLIFIPAFFNQRQAGTAGVSPFKLRKRRLKEMILNRTETLMPSRIPSIAALVLLGVGLFSLQNSPLRLSPVLRQPVIFAHLELAEGESVESADEKIKHLAALIGGIPGVSMIHSTSRRSGGELAIVFEPDKIKRERLLGLITEKGSSIPGGFLYLPEGRGGDSLAVEIFLTGPEIPLLKTIAKKTVTSILRTQWALDGVLHFKEDPPAVFYVPDRKIMSRVGINPVEAARFIRWNLQGPVADKWQQDGKEKDLRVMAGGDYKLSREGLAALTMPVNGSTAAFRLDQLGTFIPAEESSRINRRGRQHSVSFTILLDDEDPQILLEKLWAQLEYQDVPPGYAFSPSSELVEKQDFYRHLWFLFAMTILLIFFLLSIERESLVQALLILLPLPLILCFPMITTALLGEGLGTETILGLILLSGLAINNGILIFDKLDCRKKITPERICMALRSRFNGLILTTATSIGGFIPLVFTNEPFFINLGIILLCGFSGSLIVSLFIFPQIILFSVRLLHRQKRYESI